jgi:hypothetical protein
MVKVLGILDGKEIERVIGGGRIVSAQDEKSMRMTGWFSTVTFIAARAVHPDPSLRSG